VKKGRRSEWKEGEERRPTHRRPAREEEGRVAVRFLKIGKEMNFVFQRERRVIIAVVGAALVLVLIFLIITIGCARRRGGR
jgi:hypothetical protein